MTLLSLNTVLGAHTLVARYFGSLVDWQLLPAHVGWWLVPAALAGAWIGFKLIADRWFGWHFCQDFFRNFPQSVRACRCSTLVLYCEIQYDYPSLTLPRGQ